MRDFVRKGLRLLAALFVALAAWGCGDGTDVSFLKAQPEYNLVYPGATVLSSQPGGGFGGSPSVVQEFKTSSTLTDVATWYTTELGNRKWVGSQDRDAQRGTVYDWYRPCLQLSLHANSPTGNQTQYEVTFSLIGSCVWERASNLQSLRELPETSVAPPGVEVLQAETFMASRQQDGSTFLRVQRVYRWPGGTPAAVQFYDNALVSRGWTRVETSPGERFGSADVAAKWQKGQIVAVLGDGTNSFLYGLGELLDSQGSPLPPPSAIPLT